MSATLCPPESIAAWSFSLPDPMQWGTYDLVGLSGVPGLLSIIYLTGRVDTFTRVPQAVAQAFQISANPLQFYETRIRRVYKQALLISRPNCPLELQQGGLLTF